MIIGIDVGGSTTKIVGVKAGEIRNLMELLSFMEFSMFVRENLLLIRRLSVLDTVVRRNGVKRLANC